jgi:hypothetical protein
VSPAAPSARTSGRQHEKEDEQGDWKNADRSRPFRLIDRRLVGCESRIRHAIPTGDGTHECLHAFGERRPIGLLLEIRPHDFPDATRGGIGDDPLEAIAGLDAHMTGSGLMVLSGNEEEHQPRVAPGIARIGFGTNAPTPTYRQGHLGFVSLADRGERDGNDLGAGGSLEPLDQRV